MSLEYLLLFGLGLAVATVLAVTGTGIAEFVIENVKELLQ